MTRQFWANLALCLFLGAMVMFSIVKLGSALTPQGLFISDPHPSQDAEKLMKDIVLAKFQIGESQKNMVEADFYIKNNSNKSIKNICIQCEFFDEKGMYRDRQKWVLAEIVPALHELKISTEPKKRFVNTGARAMRCSITDFQLVKKPSFTIERHVGGGHGEASASGHGGEAPSGH